MRRAAKPLLAACGGFALATTLYEGHRQTLSNSRKVLPQPTVFNRVASDSLAWLMANRVHLLLLGPTGVGKTFAVKQAAGSGPRGNVTLLPFYVNLEEFISRARDDPPDKVRERVAAAFAAEAREYEGRLLRVLYNDMHAWLWLRLSDVLPASLSTDSLKELKRLSHLPEQRDPSLYALLTHLTEAATLKASLQKYASAVLGQRTFVPVLIIDEVHLLDAPDLAPIMDDLLRFVGDHVHAKRDAAVTIVLLSSDARAADTVSNWGRVARRLRTERLGDLHDNELLPFLEFLARTIPSEAAEKRFRAMFQETASFTTLRTRHGGYVSDLVALRDKYLAAGAAGAGTPGPIAAQDLQHACGLALLLRTEATVLHVTDAPADVLEVHDASAVASLAASTQLRTVLHNLSLPPEHVATVFEAILRHGVSPRGAVPLDSLRKVPLECIQAMRGANLIELRQGNVVGWEEYAELVPLKGVPYVCAPSPLARESMALVLAQLQRGSLWQRIWQGPRN